MPLGRPPVAPWPARHLRWVRRWPVGLRFGLAVLAGGATTRPNCNAGSRAGGVAWDAFALASLGLLRCPLLTADAGHTRAVAAHEAPGCLVAFGLLPLTLASCLEKPTSACLSLADQFN